MTDTKVTPRTRARRRAARARQRRDRVIGVVAQVVAAVVALAVLGGVLSGGQWPWVLATYLRWPQTIVMLAVAATLLRLGWWRSGVPAAVAAAGMVASLVAPLQALETVDAARSETLRIAVHNTGVEAGDADAFASAISDADADLVVLLESEDIAGELDRRLNRHALLTASAPADAATAPPVVLARGAWPASVVPVDGGRPATIVRAEIAGQPLDVVAFHPLPPLVERWADSHRRSIAALVEGVLPRKVPHVLACDCNTTPWSPSMRRLLDAGLRGPTVLPTFGAPAVGIPLDHVLLSDGVHAVAREHAAFSGSDHRMIVTEVTLTPRETAGSG
ncbi:MAG TPA: endonuclease/exonuclease/phosphatase family protein [Euzebyales bacterium]